MTDCHIQWGSSDRCAHRTERRRWERTMKRMGILLAVSLLAASILSGCVIVPVGGWYRPYPYRPYPYYYPHYYP